LDFFGNLKFYRNLLKFYRKSIEILAGVY